ncbi:MAG: helix-turn-helix domain-containing protein [Gammaproteobacteria bacterium]|jgi:Fis family transcriptional regulator
MSADGKRETPPPLCEQVASALERYFADLNGEQPSKLYDLVLEQVERPLLEVVMRESRGNISRAAQILGLNRATLRSRLIKYGLNSK